MKKYICFLLKQSVCLSLLLFLSSCETGPQMPTLSTIKNKRGQDSSINNKIATQACKNAQQEEESARAALAITNTEIAQNAEMLKLCLENRTEQSVENGGCEYLEKKLNELKDEQLRQQEQLRKAEEKLVAECDN